MHGTWVNDKKIKPVRDVAITANDVLTFGTEVTRGSGKLLADSEATVLTLQKHFLPSELASSSSGSIHGEHLVLLIHVYVC